jgi:fumarate reductase flavoprotein subunit
MHKYDARGERATRDIVSRAIYEEMRSGRTTPMGGVYIEMAHLGPEKVAEAFPGMVRRCADCGFDLAGGRVEVVPTAHYLMGGAEFEPDTSTAMPGLFAAGEDCGGVHGANRLGGNGVANSTVFGGISGDSMAAFVASEGWREADESAIDASVARAEYPFSQSPGDLLGLRERVWQTMWDDVGVLRDEAGVKRGLAKLDAHEAELDHTGLADGDRRFNLTWHDWLNLKSLLLASKVIATAALAREDSRGAHYREDFPETGDLEATRYTRISLDGEDLKTEMAPVSFDIVEPGQTLLDPSVAAE